MQSALVILRHGDRTPVVKVDIADVRDFDHMVDFDELRGTPFGTEAAGLLTRRGAQQLKTLGETMRRIYVDQLDALPACYDPHHVHLRSTNFS